MKNPISYNILLPVNRTSRRFLAATNKIRRFFSENTVSCIPCVSKPFDLLINTRKLKYHSIKIIEFNHPIKNTNFSEARHGICFNGALDKRKALLADYLRSEIIEQYDCVLLPKAISNFLNSNQVKHYISNKKFKSLEQQRKFYFDSKKVLTSEEQAIINNTENANA